MAKLSVAAVGGSQRRGGVVAWCLGRRLPMGTGRAGGRLRRDGTIWPGRRGDASRVAAARLGGGRAGKRAGGLGAAVVVVEVVVVVNVKRSRGPEGAEDEEGRGRGGTRGREKGLRSWLRGEGEGERIVVVNKKKRQDGPLVARYSGGNSTIGWGGQRAGFSPSTAGAAVLVLVCGRFARTVRAARKPYVQGLWGHGYWGRSWAGRGGSFSWQQPAREVPHGGDFSHLTVNSVERGAWAVVAAKYPSMLFGWGLARTLPFQVHCIAAASGPSAAAQPLGSGFPPFRRRCRCCYNRRHRRRRCYRCRNYTGAGHEARRSSSVNLP